MTVTAKPSAGPDLSAYPGGEALYRLRHSAAHVLATAVTELFPDVKVAGGPPVEGGFYYDFARGTPFTPEALVRIAAQLRADRRRGPREARRGVAQARPSPPRPRAGPVLDPRGGGRRSGPLAPSARDGAPCARELLERRALQARLPVRVHAAHREREALRDLRPPRELRRHHVRSE